MAAAALPSAPMRIRLQPKQDKLATLLMATGPDVPTVIGAGGAKGGGKSAGARNIALTIAVELGDKYPGLTLTIVRRVARHLRDNHIQPLFRTYPDLLRFWRATDSELQLPNGSRILFRSAETDADVERQFTGGFESAIIIVDEAQQFSERELAAFQMAARWTQPGSQGGAAAGLAKLLLLFNPGGIGGPYIRRIFWTREYTPQERAGYYAFIHIFGWDNYEWFRGQVDIGEEQFYQMPGNCGGGNNHAQRCCRFHMFISETSEGKKYDSFPPAIRAGFLLGSFDHFEGQYFAGAWESSCIVPASTVSRLIQPWWTRWMATDWGWAGPPRPHYAVNLWFAIGKLAPSALEEKLGIESEWPLDVVIVYRERHACLTPEPQFAQQVVDATPMVERSEIGRHFVDGSMFATDRKSDNTTADLMRPIFERAGFPQMVPADKDRIGGWRQLYNALLRTAKARRAPVVEEPDGPLLMVSAECPEVARAIPRLICDEDRPEDVLKTEAIEDDYGDTLRYGYKSMQEAQWEAPREVRRQELYQSFEERGRTEENMSNMAMALRRFDESERSRHKRVKRRR